MPDLDLRDALHDLTDGVTLVDVLPRVEKRLAVRRRHRMISAGVATLLVIGGAVAAVAATNHGTGDSLPPASPRPSTPTPTPSEPPGSQATEPSFTVSYLPPGFDPVVDPDAGGPPPAGISRQAFQDDGPDGAMRSLSVEVLRGDAFSDVNTYAAENGHLRLTQVGGQPGAVGWNVPGHDGLHLAYRVVGDGVAVQVVERDSRAVPLSDAELSRVAASVRIP